MMSKKYISKDPKRCIDKFLISSLSFLLFSSLLFKYSNEPRVHYGEQKLSEYESRHKKIPNPEYRPTCKCDIHFFSCGREWLRLCVLYAWIYIYILLTPFWLRLMFSELKKRGYPFSSKKCHDFFLYILVFKCIPAPAMNKKIKH